MLGIERVKDRVTKESATAECSAVFEKARHLALPIGKEGLRRNTLRTPPTPAYKSRRDVHVAAGRVFPLAAMTAWLAMA